MSSHPSRHRRGVVLAVIVIAILGVAVSACGSAVSTGGPSGAGTSGVAAASGGAYGRITASPTCPVERPGNVCQRPVIARVEAHTPGGVIVATTSSDKTGRYLFRLPPQTYVLNVVTGAMFPRCRPATVTVLAGGSTRADITCDTGIR